MGGRWGWVALLCFGCAQDARDLEGAGSVAPSVEPSSPPEQSFPRAEVPKLPREPAGLSRGSIQPIDPLCFDPQIGEAIPPPPGGWDHPDFLEDDFETPVVNAPFGFFEPAPCVADARPSLSDACEVRTYSADGRLLHVIDPVSQSEEPTPGEVYTADFLGKSYERHERRWTFDESGYISEWTETVSAQGELQRSTHWQLRYTCDGRPSHYEGADWGERRFLYDSEGRMLRRVAPREYVSWAFDQAGRLRAREEYVATIQMEKWSTDWLDGSGRVLATTHRHQGHMGSGRGVTQFEPGPNGPLRSYGYAQHGGHSWSFATEYEYDEQGRLALTWSSNGTATRNTWSCESQELVRQEEVDADGGVRAATWTWLPEEQVVREISQYGERIDHHFDCAE